MSTKINEHCFDEFRGIVLSFNVCDPKYTELHGIIEGCCYEVCGCNYDTQCVTIDGDGGGCTSGEESCADERCDPCANSTDPDCVKCPCGTTPGPPQLGPTWWLTDHDERCRCTALKCGEFSQEPPRKSVFDASDTPWVVIGSRVRAHRIVPDSPAAEINRWFAIQRTSQLLTDTTRAVAQCANGSCGSAATMTVGIEILGSLSPAAADPFAVLPVFTYRSRSDSDTPFGWSWFSSLDPFVAEVSSSNAVVVSGTGHALVYTDRDPGTGVYKSPAETSMSLRKNANGTFLLILQR